MPEGPSKLRETAAKPGVWVATTYFAEGFPYSVVNSLAEILFKELGASLQVIGLTSLFHLPWNLKFLWGPFVDGYETKRRWLIACELAIVVLIALLALLSVGGTAALWLLAIGFLLLGLLSATHDIAVDGYYLEALDSIAQSKWVGFRAAAYRLAMVAVGGPLVWLCASFGWLAGLLVAAALMGALLGYHALLLPSVEARQHAWTRLLALLVGPRGLVLLAALLGLALLEHYWALGTALRYAAADVVDARPSLAWLSAKLGGGAWIGFALLFALLLTLALLPLLRKRLQARRDSEGLSDYAANFVSFLEQPRVALILAFVILFRTGESFLQKMRWPFLDDVIHLPLEHFATINGTIGVIASFTATIVGGRLIARDGLRRWIWPFVLAQNLLNLLYVGLALLPWTWFPVGAESLPASLELTVVTGAIVAEHFGAGLGTAVFMVYIMRTCDPAHKAGHMAIVTAVMSVSFTIAGVGSGFIAAQIGYAWYFAFTFAATIPAMALIPFIPYLDGRGEQR